MTAYRWVDLKCDRCGTYTPRVCAWTFDDARSHFADLGWTHDWVSDYCPDCSKEDDQ